MKKMGTIIDGLKRGEKGPNRHENPYLSEALALSGYLFTQSELQSKYLNLFERDLPIVVEIGCYLGKTTLELSTSNKNMNFIGLDITYKRAVKAARKLKNISAENGKIGICDGTTFLTEIVPDSSLTGVCVFFPDPWPKKRHVKKRLLNESFVNLLLRKLKTGGFFWLKTDAEEYFSTTHALLLKAGFSVEPPSLEQTNSQPSVITGGPYETIFQKIFKDQNIGFYQCVYLKTSEV